MRASGDVIFAIVVALCCGLALLPGPMSGLGWFSAGYSAGLWTAAWCFHTRSAAPAAAGKESVS